MAVEEGKASRKSADICLFILLVHLGGGVVKPDFKIRA